MLLNIYIIDDTRVFLLNRITKRIPQNAGRRNGN